MATYNIGNMDCANCAKEVETGVARLDGVKAVHVDFSSGTMTLDGEVDFATLRQRVEALGKTIATGDDANDKATQPAQPARRGVAGFVDYLLSRHETRLALAGGALTLLTLALTLLAGLSENVAGILYTAAMLIAVYPIARQGINTLRINRAFNINLLMTIAAVGAVIIGEYLEASTVIFLFAIGEALEGYTTDRARDSLRSLIALKPAQALRLSADETTESVPVEALDIGDRVLVKPGEQIPADGEVATGTSSVDQAPITGESVPVAKSIGSEVFAGTINGPGTLTITVTRRAEDNTLSRMVQLVAEAQSTRAPSQRLIDRFAAVYTPAIILIALAVALVPPLVFGGPFYDTPDTRGWLYRALTILVIGCPCALVISTPVTVISAITAAARRGVLIKGGAHLETLGRVRTFAFDKTGTLTQGKPAVTLARSLECAPDGIRCDHCDDLLTLAASVEAHSTHPLARAVLDAAESRQLAYHAAENVEVLAGRGVRGHVDGAPVTLGSHGYFDATYPHAAGLCARISELESGGQTTMLLHDGTRVRGYIALADEVRPESAAVLREMNALGLQTVMLTGDNATVAASISTQIGLGDYRAGLLPEDKVSAVRALTEKGEVAMVGDGINDAPALAAASVGVAMGGAGSAQALETADVVLMADDLRQLPFAVRLARFGRQLIRQNIAMTFALKALFLVLATGGAATLWMAVFADVGMSLVVTLNGMRPLRRVAQK